VIFKLSLKLMMQLSTLTRDTETEAIETGLEVAGVETGTASEETEGIEVAVAADTRRRSTPTIPV
jgi:hypothetical protein